MRIFLVVLFVLLISETITKPRDPRHRHMKKGSRSECPKGKRCEPSTRKSSKGKPSTSKLDEIRKIVENTEHNIIMFLRDYILDNRDKLIENRRKINAILENVSDLKNQRSKKENYYDEYSGSGLSSNEYSGYGSGNGPKAKNKLLSGKVDTLLENMSDLKTIINNALEGKMRDVKQNEDNPSNNPRTKPANNLPHPFQLL